jgi:putative copper resistance protein D
MRQTFHRALARFSGIGSALVAVLLLTGLVNGWVLIGLDRLDALWTTAYGQLLTLKLALFTAMVILAAMNRFRHTPAFGRNYGDAGLETLRRSIALEALAGLAVLALVAWLGTLEPMAST